MSARPRGKKLALESLEPRQVCTGNVALSASGGNVSLIGDNQGNEVHVSVTPTAITVTGVNTTVNGKSQIVLNRTQLNLWGGLNVDLGGGDDKTIIRGWGDANRVDVAWLVVNMGAGSLERVFVGGLYAAGSIDIYGPQDRSDLTISNVRTGSDLNINTGNGRDAIDLTGLNIGRHLRVFTNGGNDGITLGAPNGQYSLVGGEVRIDTGAGNDVVDVGRIQVDEFYAWLGDGDDRIGSFSYSTSRRRVTLNGGDGKDVLNLNSTLNTPRVVTSGF